MLTRQQRSTNRRIASVLAITICVLTSSASAQLPEKSSSGNPSFLWGVTKQVIFDPTTYAPAAIAYDATKRDWNTSQPLFRNGYVEKNPRFTVSGFPNDIPMSYQDGNRRILDDALVNLQVSLVNNFTDRILERVLLEKYPEHRKLVRTLGWVERIGFGTYMSYLL